jgi:hypothetical protein
MLIGQWFWPCRFRYLSNWPSAPEAAVPFFGCCLEFDRGFGLLLTLLSGDESMGSAPEAAAPVLCRCEVAGRSIDPLGLLDRGFGPSVSDLFEEVSMGSAPEAAAPVLCCCAVLDRGFDLLGSGRSKDPVYAPEAALLLLRVCCVTKMALPESSYASGASCLSKGEKGRCCCGPALTCP